MNPLTYTKLDREAFEALVADHPDVVVPLEQTPYWADFETAMGRNAYGIWAYFDAGSPVALASYLLLERRFRNSLVVVNGPTWLAQRTPEAEQRFVDTVLEQFSDDPAVDPLYIRMQVQHPKPPVTDPIEHGWYEREIVVDLRPDEKAIAAGFRPNARNCIRKARKTGVEVRFIDASERTEVFRRELYPIMEETAERDKFASFGSDFYETLLDILGDKARLGVAYLEGRAVCWLISTEYRGHAVYLFAGSSHAARQSNAAYLLLWETFLVLKAAGNTACGLTGIVSDNYPQLINVTSFKRNFSKNVVNLPTTYDIPLNPVKYRIVAGALNARRTLPGRVRGLMTKAGNLTMRNVNTRNVRETEGQP